MAVKKRYCEHCDGINSGGFYDDICMVQELSELSDKYGFEYKDKKTGEWVCGCQVPAKVWRELEDMYCSPFGSDDYSGFAICNALEIEKNMRCKKCGSDNSDRDIVGGICVPCSFKEITK